VIRRRHSTGSFFPGNSNPAVTMPLERPPSLHDGNVERNDNSRDAVAIAQKKHPRKQMQKQRRGQKQKRKKKAKRKKTSSLIFLVLTLCTVSYMFLVYHSLQFAGQGLDRLTQLDTPKASRRHQNQNRKKHRNARKRDYTILEMFFNAFKEPENMRKKGAAARRSVKHPTLVPKFVAPEKLLLPKPIINVGFPKAGTSTIFSFFHCNGLKAQHWYCCEDQKHPGHAKFHKLMSSCMLKNIAANRPIFENCGDFDVYSEINGPRQFKETNGTVMMDDGTLMPASEFVPRKNRIFFPQHHHLDKIHQQYPNATLILNNRDTEAWVNSVLSWDVNLQYELLNEFYQQNATSFLFANATNGTATTNETAINVGKTERQPKRRKKKNTPYAPFSNNVQRRTFLESVYHYHQQYIRDWVSSHPTHALIEVNIADVDAGKTLATSFGLQEECWGHFNKKTKEKLKPNKPKPIAGLRNGSSGKPMKISISAEDLRAIKVPESYESNRNQIGTSEKQLQISAQQSLEIKAIENLETDQNRANLSESPDLLSEQQSQESKPTENPKTDGNRTSSPEILAQISTSQPQEIKPTENRTA